MNWTRLDNTRAHEEALQPPSALQILATPVLRAPPTLRAPRPAASSLLSTTGPHFQPAGHYPGGPDGGGGGHGLPSSQLPRDLLNRRESAWPSPLPLLLSAED